MEEDNFCAELAMLLITTLYHLLSIYYVPGPGLSPKDIDMNFKKRSQNSQSSGGNISMNQLYDFST